MTQVTFRGQLDIFRISDKQYLGDCGKKGDLSRLGADEYFSYSVYAQNNGDRPFTWDRAWVCVDNGPLWSWPGGRIQPSQRVRLRIGYENMKTCMTPGRHTAVWYFDGQAVHRENFVITGQSAWEKRFPIPSGQEIANYRNPHQRRSPYLACWFVLSPETRYSEYMVDFRAAHLPRGTYCCLGCWTMDHSGLKKQYQQVRTESSASNAYAGFQKLADGRMVSIMSFWDVFCRDAQGREVTIRAKRLYPEAVIDGGRFWGEGTGERSTAPFAWEADHWYRMHLKCVASPGTTLVEQWVTDLETGGNTLLCRYDVGVPASAFMGNIAVFLENFLPETAGEVRSMEVRNARYLQADTRQWHRIRSGYLYCEGGAPAYEGSYNYGVTGDRIWMITSGVGGDWYNNGKGKKGMNITLP